MNEIITSICDKRQDLTGIEKNAAKCCLSRLYFALNRIQGALQIDKKEGNKRFGMFKRSKK